MRRRRQFGPRGPRGRGRRLVGPLRLTTAAAFAVAVAGIALPGAWGRAAARALVVLLVAVPVARVAFLGVRWWQIEDPRFTAAAAAVLVVLAAGAALSALS